MVNLEKLRAGICNVQGAPPNPFDSPATWQDLPATEALMRQAADEIEELRRENARLQVENNRLFNANRRGPP